MSKYCSKCKSKKLLSCCAISAGLIHTICNECGHIDIYNQEIHDQMEKTAERYLKEHKMELEK